MGAILNFLKSTRGNAESAMVIVPLALLFLIGMQISVAAHARNLAKISAQDEASKRAISGEFTSDDQFIHIDTSGDGQNLDLLIVHRESGLIDLVPRFLGEVSSGKSIEVEGFAVIENQR